jgi:phage-related protein
MTWNINYYDTKVRNDIYDLEPRMLAKYIALIDRMSISGPNLGLPHSKAMSKGLFELRLTGNDGIARIFYCTLKDNNIVMLHTFIKKTQKTPDHQLDIARDRLKEIKK